MESQRHVQQEENVGIDGSSKISGFLCRQSNTRWIPTAEQIRILRDLYYNKGLRSPNAEQIQRISARLRQYGKIEGKNVFYWFQNHKARERQKKRLAADHLAVQAASSTPDAPDGWSTCEEASSKLTSIAASRSINGNSSCCDSAVGAVVELGAAARGANLRMERGNDIRESEVLSSRNKHANETVVDSWYGFFCVKDSSETSDQTDGEAETLQLFPLGSGNESDHGIDPKLELGRESQGTTSWFAHHNEHDASLELTLKMIGGKKSERLGG